MTCDCSSSNRPELGGNTPAIVMPYFRYGGEKSVSVDACIAEAVMQLWIVGIKTLGSCCGHNGKLGRPMVVVDNPQAVEAAALILSLERVIEPGHVAREWEVFCWKDGVLVSNKMA